MEMNLLEELELLKLREEKFLEKEKHRRKRENKKRYKRHMPNKSESFAS